jgi:hypothetical protein
MNMLGEFVQKHGKTALILKQILTINAPVINVVKYATTHAISVFLHGLKD